MKKNYTVFLLLLTLSAYAQRGKVKETSEQDVYFKQDGENILVYRGSLEGSTSNGYAFAYGKDEKINIIKTKKSVVPTFTSPNEVVIVQDEAGNRYWKLIDGTIVKTELEREVSTLPKAEEMPVINKREEKKPEKLTEVNEASTVVNEVPEEIVEEKQEVVSPEKEIEIQIEEANVVEDKSKEFLSAPEVKINQEQKNSNEAFGSEEIIEEISSPAPQIEEKTVEVEPIVSPAPQIEEKTIEIEPIVSPAPQIEEKTVKVEPIVSPAPQIEEKTVEIEPIVNPTPRTEEKTIEIKSIVSPAPQIEEKAVEMEPIVNPAPRTEEKTIEIESIVRPAPQIERDEKIEVSIPNEGKEDNVEVEEDKKIISTIGEDGIEQIQVIGEEVGDTSDFFEKNYEDMTRKEKKLYKKNERKLMRELEKELKK
ncbi:hypothetical protein [uncultured Apibacter sp.]|uniref:hypothetical protein n=1 Tax=uncultured Apibacter sp. TaxID=1778616 RepID=UPI0025D1687A|nr:hypothetical protein [uncultured Apibacter sp.]